jgi:hypothetical protein
MRTPCRYGQGGGHGDGRAARAGAGRRQVFLVVELEEQPMVELAAAKLLLLATDELRADGFVICQVRLGVEG